MNLSVEELLKLAVEREASDVHLSVPGPAAIRLKGELEPLAEAGELSEADMEAALTIVTTDDQRRRFRQDRELDFAYVLPDVARFRVNACYQRGTVSLSFRPLAFHIPSMDSLRLPAICRELVLKPRGLVMVTGPTGSGKSTTLAAMVDYLNENRKAHVVTIEDPIEYLYTSKKSLIIQREVGSDTGSFAGALRRVLRQDPDVILIGEMRDLETISVALTAAETGHLVLGTLHTVSAVQTVERVVDVFPPHQQAQVRFQLSLVLEAVLSQALLPLQGKAGRVASFEVLTGTPAIRNLVRDGKTHEMMTYLESGRQHGMQTMDWALAELVKAGLVAREEALARASHQEGMTRLLGPKTEARGSRQP